MALVQESKAVENITVRSIIGRFLEHHRAYYFWNDGQEELYLSSADMMHRNLSERVELMFPVERHAHIERIKAFLDLCLQDNRVQIVWSFQTATIHPPRLRSWPGKGQCPGTHDGLVWRPMHPKRNSPFPSA